MTGTVSDARGFDLFLSKYMHKINLKENRRGSQEWKIHKKW